MAKHLNILEKEFLIKRYREGSNNINRFCEVNNISTTSFKKWLNLYKEEGLDGLIRTDAKIKDMLPVYIDKSIEAYKREVLRLTIENERLKKNYYVRTNQNGELEYVHLRKKSTK